MFDRPQTLASGTHTVRFGTALPEGLPPSAIDQVTENSFGSIYFTTTAKLVVRNASSGGSRGEIVTTAAFEYIPHMYLDSKKRRNYPV